jgi:DNA-binding transcriptional LysR family regulator
MKNWDNLRYLLALVRGGSPAGAARLLKVDESTVRRRLAALEQDAGAILIERDPLIWQLTRAGTTMLQSAEQAEQAIARAEAGLDANDPVLAGSVRVGAPDGIGSMVIAPALARLRRQAPELMIELVTHGSPADLARREVDLQLILERPSNGRHRIRKLRPVELKLYGARDYLDASAPIHSVADLACHSLVGYDPSSDFAGAAIRQLASAGIAIPPGLTCSTVFAQTHALAAGAGLALLPDYMITPEMDLVPVLPDTVSITIELWLLTHADVAGRARVRAVAEAIAMATSRRESGGAPR